MRRDRSHSRRRTGSSFAVILSSLCLSLTALGPALTLAVENVAPLVLATAASRGYLASTVDSEADPQIGLEFNGTAADRVGAGNVAAGSDGGSDGVFTITLEAGGLRTVTGIHVNRQAGGAWDTDSATGFWIAGAASTLNGALLNDPENVSVNFALNQGDSFLVFVSDVKGLLFDAGESILATVMFDDGTNAEASVVLGEPVALPDVGPRIGMEFNGTAADRVGAGNVAAGSDGGSDGVFTITLEAGGLRTVTGIHVNRQAGGAWDTDSGTGFWIAGVAPTLNDALLNDLGDASVNFALSQGGSFLVFVSDVDGLLFNAGESISATVMFDDGTSAAANVVLGESVLLQDVGPQIGMAFHGTTRDRVGAGNVAAGSDGGNDGVFSITLQAGGSRTVTGIRVNRQTGGSWDADSGTGFWIAGAARTLNGALLNDLGNASVNFALSEDDSFLVFLSDFDGLLFNAGASISATVIFDDGTSAPTNVVLGEPAPWPVNRGPTANAGVNQTVKEGDLVSLDGSASSDPEGLLLSYSWMQTGGMPVILSDPDGVAPTFSAPTDILTNEVLTFQLIVNDGELPSAPDSVDVTVERTSNQPPVLTSTPVAVAAVGEPYSYAAGATDPDQGDQLTFTLDTAPAGAGIDSTTGLISWTPSAAQVGVNNFTLRVTDDGAGALFDEQSFTVNVTQPGVAVHRINAGGPAYMDSLGNHWSADLGFNTGNTFSVTSGIGETDDQALYQNERWDPEALPELSYSLPVDPGTYLVRLHFADICPCTNQPGLRVFDVAIEGETVLSGFDIVAEVGPLTAITKEFVVDVADGSVEIEFGHVTQEPKISAIEVIPQQSDHGFRHVVANVPPLVVDYNGDGFEDVFLEGSFSHTHEPGHSLTGFEWSAGGVPFSNEADVTVSFPIGSHTVSLTITDDNTPAETLTDSATFVVASTDQVPGTLVRYYEADGGNPAELLTAVPATADFTEQRSGLRLDNAPIGVNVMVQFQTRIDVSATGTYTFQTTGGGSSILLIDGVPVTGPLVLSAGVHALDARFALHFSEELPLEVTLAQGGGAQLPIDEGSISYDLSNLAPVVNGIAPTEGSELGGNTVEITGLGFFQENEVVVHWGAIDLSGSQLATTPTAITLRTPPGEGLITVTVETPRGVSNSFEFNYFAHGPLPINFGLRDVATGIVGPTTVALGPDGRLYVGTQFGEIQAITFDDDYNVTGIETISTIAGLTNANILGLAFNPFDPPEPVRLYVAHSQLFANGGSCFTGLSPYSGQVSVLEGPDFDVVEPVLTGGPVSNHDHGTNGMDFDTNGDLYVAVGGNTNAGVLTNCALGGLPESPLSGAILKAEISRPDFNGDIVYEERDTGFVNDDQVFGDIVDVAPGVDVSVYAPGFRNSYDLAFTTRNLIYATDNGPNLCCGPASTGPNSQGPNPEHDDELNLVEFGRYYGHPNRNQGLYDARRYIYRDLTGPSIPGVFTQAIASFPPSTNGIVEYRANTFNGAMRGDLLAQKWNGSTFRVTLAPDGRSVDSQQNFPVSLDSLDLTTGPGGVLFGADHGENKVVIAEPIETVGHFGVYDIFPWRAPAAGGHPFTIGGKDFGGLSDTTVTIGGVEAPLTSVTSSKIHGTIPARNVPSRDLLDVAVTVGGQTRLLPAAFRYLLPPGNEPYGWRVGAPLPVPLGEVASGVIDGVLYVVGDGSAATLGYDIAAATWINPSDLATRPFPGHHQAAEVVNGKLYLFGGLHDGSPGKVQIYDPVTDSWSLGTDMPWAAGSSSSALIGGDVYVCGGIVGNSTVTDCGKYDPVENTWTPLASMIDGRNHAPSGTDGEKFYIFGGRGPGSGNSNILANGFADVQIYDPVTNAWKSSNEPDSALAPLPQARGGSGKAVFYNGEFYVMGGETLDGAGATPTAVYDRVDIYDPANNTWRVGPPMPTGRHGIFPILYHNQIYVGGGGEIAGFAISDLLEIYAP